MVIMKFSLANDVHIRKYFGEIVGKSKKRLQASGIILINVTIPR
jgi:hypothetical protein